MGAKESNILPLPTAEKSFQLLNNCKYMVNVYKTQREKMIALSYDNVTSGSVHPLAAEIDISPLWKIKNMRLTYQWCILDKKCILNTNSKPWSLYQTVTLLPV